MKVPGATVTVAARLAMAGAALVTVGCGGGGIPRATAPEAPTRLAKCSVAASQHNPLVTEWPASEKANLEVRLREGGVVVAYSGCEMRLLQQCRVPGSYAWQRTTVATDAIEIRSEDDLYAKLPLGAVSLEGELRASGRLAMRTTVAGQLRLRGLTPAQVPNAGPCQGATHLVGALSVGAFKLKSGGALAGRAGAGFAGAEAQAGTASEEILVREAGDPQRCSESTDAEPNGDCRSPVQIFLWPLPWIEQQQGPPGTVKIDFVAGDADTRWDVLAGGRVLCGTPCTQWLPPSTPLMMRESESSFFNPAEEVDVDDLSVHAADAPLEVRAQTSSFAMWAGGLTLTSLAGIATVAGIVLTAVGCSQLQSGDAGSSEESLCAAGAVTGSVGLLALVPGIWLTVAGGPHADVLPSQHLPPTGAAGPGNVSGVLTGAF